MNRIQKMICCTVFMISTEIFSCIQNRESLIWTLKIKVHLWTCANDLLLPVILNQFLNNFNFISSLEWIGTDNPSPFPILLFFHWTHNTFTLNLQRNHFIHWNLTQRHLTLLQTLIGITAAWCRTHLRFEKVMDTTCEEINDLTIELVNCYEKILSYWKKKIKTNTSWNSDNEATNPISVDLWRIFHGSFCIIQSKLNGEDKSISNLWCSFLYDLVKAA